MTDKNFLRAPARALALALVFALAFIIALSLTSCSASRRAEEKMLELRTALLASEKLTAIARIRADYGERAFEFKIKFTGDADGGELEILEPESVAGIRARVTGSGAELIFDGAALDTGPLGDGLSPVGIIPLLISEWKTGFVDTLTPERLDGRAVLAMTSSLTEKAAQTTWFDEATGLPVRAEAIADGRAALTIEFENVSY
ncbi:MAG: hypothetical protein LBH17_02720 [Oscillospiraceae bacterium]|nr:hypothetical protein [Oscillospiraceae bacterium]